MAASFGSASVAHGHGDAERTRKRLVEAKLCKVVDMLVRKLDDF